jgi:hypothetical protein
MDLEILKEAYEALPDDKKALYEEKDGKYQPTREALVKEVEGLLAFKKNEAKKDDEYKAAKAKIKEIEAKEAAAKKAIEEKELEAKIKAGEFDSVMASYEDKIKAARDERAEEVAQLKAHINKLVVETDVFNMAKELSVTGAEPLLMDRIRPRVRAKYTDDGVVPEYLNEHGQPTAFNRAEFKKQIELDPSCKLIIRGSEASGGGHQGAAATSTTNASQGGVGGKVAAKLGGTTQERRAYFEAKYGEKLKTV